MPRFNWNSLSSHTHIQNMLAKCEDSLYELNEQKKSTETQQILTDEQVEETPRILNLLMQSFRSVSPDIHQC
jgi:hypothetical protein